MKLVHLPNVLCRAEKSKTELGVKFWCPICHCYVLPDESHIMRWRGIPQIKLNPAGGMSGR